jgi:DNA-binding NarL/FixJ family response regulator
MIRLLLVDDHPVILQGLQAICALQDDLDVVATASSGAAAVAAHARVDPDVTVIDLSLADMTGADIMRAIATRRPAARFVALSVLRGEEDIHRALAAGADAYVYKTAPPEELVAAIRAVHAGRRYLPRDVAARLAQRQAGMELTEREREILELIATGRSNAAIGAALGVDVGTVKSHVHRILGKLGVASRAEAIAAAIRRGLVHPA